MLVILSIEISRGNLKPKNIEDLVKIKEKNLLFQCDVGEEPNKDEKKIWKSLENYKNHIILSNKQQEYFPSLLWWKNFFDLGTPESISEDNFAQSHFAEREKENWEKLFDFRDLGDDEFNSILNIVWQEYKDRKYNDLRIILHVFGLFLLFQDCNIFDISDDKYVILDDAKEYINYLINEKLSTIIDYFKPSRDSSHWSGAFGSYYTNYEREDFRELIEYIQSKSQNILSNVHSKIVEELLENMKSNWNEFAASLSISHANQYRAKYEYYDYPILAFVNPQSILDVLNNESIENASKKESCYLLSSLLKERYNIVNYREKLQDEIPFLEKLSCLINHQIEDKPKNLSSYYLSQLKQSVEKQIVILQSPVNDDQ